MISVDIRLCAVPSMLPTRSLRDKQFLAYIAGQDVPANPLAPQARSRRHPRPMPDGFATALIDSVTTARDRMIVTWLNDSGLFSGAQPCVAA